MLERTELPEWLHMGGGGGMGGGWEEEGAVRERAHTADEDSQVARSTVTEAGGTPRPAGCQNWPSGKVHGRPEGPSLAPRLRK